MKFHNIRKIFQWFFLNVSVLLALTANLMRLWEVLTEHIYLEFYFRWASQKPSKFSYSVSKSEGPFILISPASLFLSIFRNSHKKFRCKWKYWLFVEETRLVVIEHMLISNSDSLIHSDRRTFRASPSIPSLVLFWTFWCLWRA